MIGGPTTLSCTLLARSLGLRLCHVHSLVRGVLGTHLLVGSRFAGEMCICWWVGNPTPGTPHQHLKWALMPIGSMFRGPWAEARKNRGTLGPQHSRHWAAAVCGAPK